MGAVSTNTFQNMVTTGLDWAVEGIARLPEDAVLTRAHKLISRGVKYPEGVDFLVSLLAQVRRFWPRLAPNVRRRFLENIFVREIAVANATRNKIKPQLGGWAPQLMVISPTMRCNLKCTGCYSANYSRKDKIDTATFMRVIGEARDLGIHFVVVSGGEPFIRKDFLDVAAAYPDMYFMTYTNSTFIADHGLAPKLAELGNVMPCISVEGFDKETDERRGKGTFKKIMDAMGQLRKEGVLFGFSATPMRHNNDLMVSEEFVRFWENQGCFLGWYFQYMPVGRDPDLSLMPTPEQRMRRMDRIRQIRKEHDIVIADFWCDGPLCGGCLSAGRVYFHINAQGGIEPCVFQQYSRDNIFDSSLLDALKSDYFFDMRDKLETIEDRTRPCPVIDHPEMLRDSVTRFKPKASQGGGSKTVTELAPGLDKYAAELERLANARGEVHPVCTTGQVGEA